MEWTPGKGLGRNGQGNVAPLSHTQNTLEQKPTHFVLYNVNPYVDCSRVLYHHYNGFTKHKTDTYPATSFHKDRRH